MDPSLRVRIVLFPELHQVTRLIKGIGQGRVTNNLKPDIHLLSGAIHIPDAKSIAMVYRLLHEEGLYVGASSALNVVAAVELAKRKGKGSTIVTILCDGAYRFAFFNHSTFNSFHDPNSTTHNSSRTSLDIKLDSSLENG